MSTVEELQKALEKAKPWTNNSTCSWSIWLFNIWWKLNKFKLDKDGAKSSPITLTAQDPEDPPLLRDPTPKEGTILHITENYWVIENIKIGYCGRACNT